MANTKHAVGALAALGLFLAFCGPALALISLFLGMGAESDRAADPIAVLHVTGLVGGLIGALLLLTAFIWWLFALFSIRGREQESVA